ncbi:MAG: P1 family peptidase [Fidelibacterota bacterium]
MSTPIFGMILLMIFFFSTQEVFTQYSSKRSRIRESGITVGELPVGKYNAITDVKGVKVGHVTIISGDNVRTGVTAILPHGGNIFKKKVPAGVFIGNAFGKAAGLTQVMELGNIETPIILTNTLSVGVGVQGVVKYVLQLPGNEGVVSVNAVVGETNDSYLNDIRGGHVSVDHIIESITGAAGGPVEEGAVGAGTGTYCLGFKGGIGTSSRVLAPEKGGYTVGVLVQSNFGGSLVINGVPVGKEFKKLMKRGNSENESDAVGGTAPFIDNEFNGSCMIIVATDAPLFSRALSRLAKRAVLGLARAGSIMSHGSGDFVIAFSTYEGNFIPHNPEERVRDVEMLDDSFLTPLFQAVVEATQEAVYNSLFMAKTMAGKDGHVLKALPIEETLKIIENYRHPAPK